MIHAVFYYYLEMKHHRLVWWNSMHRYDQLNDLHDYNYRSALQSQANFESMLLTYDACVYYNDDDTSFVLFDCELQCRLLLLVHSYDWFYYIAFYL